LKSKNFSPGRCKNSPHSSELAAESGPPPRFAVAAQRLIFKKDDINLQTSVLTWRCYAIDFHRRCWSIDKLEDLEFRK
jgi:hypothetical protein